MAPLAQISLLHRADGSAQFSSGGYTVLAAVNGPIEVTRRDELPQDAAIEVNVRPAIGVGSPKERHLESLLHSTLRNIILTQQHPRTLIQITLQIVSTPDEDYLLPSSFALSPLPALLNASLLSLLSASIPLSTTLTSTLACVSPSQKITLSPTPSQILAATSTHVFGFSSRGDLVLDLSEGEFDMDTWDKVFDLAKKDCCKPREGDMDEAEGNNVALETFVERVVEGRVEGERKWKNG